MLSAHMVRLIHEVAYLRLQLGKVEAMGYAGTSGLDGDQSVAGALQEFLMLAEELVSSTYSLAWVMDTDANRLKPLAALPDLRAFEGESVVPGDGILGQAAARMRPVLVADAAHHAHRGARDIAAGAWLLYPLVVHERLLGVGQWVRPSTRPFAADDVTRLGALARQAAVTLDNYHVRQRMNRLAATDGLTNLWNHRRMHEMLREEMRRAARYHRPLSVLMLDVDNFKAFNGTYGHPQGDRLLRTMASVLLANTRSVDHVGRYGGEEFLTVLPETAKEHACQLAERMRSAIEREAVVTGDDGVVRCTVSIGVASYPEDALNPSQLVQRADEALYMAKRAGKNRVLWA
jgi:diguanylate cyclase (GGDEF)-like protein